MKTAEQIIEILETELAEAYELYDLAQDKHERLFLFHKVGILSHILDEIKEG